MLSFRMSFPTPSKDSALILPEKGAGRAERGWIICSKPLTLLVPATTQPLTPAVCAVEPWERVEWERGVRRRVGVGGSRRAGLNRVVLP